MRRTRAVFFDVDFTLIYPGPFFQADGYRDFCARHGIRDCDPRAFDAAVATASALLDDSEGLAYDPSFFLRYIGRIIECMGGSGPNLERCAAEIYREWAVCRHFELYDDVLPAFHRLQEMGVSIGLISNTHRSLADFAAHFEMDGLVAAWLSSSEHGYNKPHPSIFLAALQLLDVQPDEAMMVGDNYRHDIEGARTVGMEGILLRRSAPRRGGLDRDALGLPAGVQVVRSLAEVPSLLP